MGTDAQQVGRVWRGAFDAATQRGILSGTPMLTPTLRPHPLYRLHRAQMATLLATAALLLTGASAGSFAQVPAKSHKKSLHPHRLERQQVEALEQSWQQALLADDGTAMDKLLSDDYLGVTTAGDLVTKSQQLDRMRDKTLVVTKLQTSDSKIKLIGHIAIVTSLAEIEASSDGKPVQGSFRYTQVCQRLPNGTWKITSFEATRVDPGYKLKHQNAEPGQ